MSENSRPLPRSCVTHPATNPARLSRIGHGQERVAPRVGFPTDAGQARPYPTPAMHSPASFRPRTMLTGRMLVTRDVCIGVIGQRALEDEKRQPRKEHQAVHRPGSMIDLDRSRRRPRSDARRRGGEPARPGSPGSLAPRTSGPESLEIAEKDISCVSNSTIRDWFSILRAARRAAASAPMPDAHSHCHAQNQQGVSPDALLHLHGTVENPNSVS